jgi:putative N6-adenine-specific DNA methylase
MPPGAALRFRVTSRKSRLYHADGIAERLVEAAGGGTAGADLVQEFVVRVYRDEVTISPDASGALLHQRGYRLATAKAPSRDHARPCCSGPVDGTVPLLTRCADQDHTD